MSADEIIRRVKARLEELMATTIGKPPQPVVFDVYPDHTGTLPFEKPLPDDVHGPRERVDYMGIPERRCILVSIDLWLALNRLPARPR